MPTPSQSTFPHRHNIDGTYDSICTTCFATVATQRVEEDLALPEQIHVCDPFVLETRSLFKDLSKISRELTWHTTAAK